MLASCIFSIHFQHCHLNNAHLLHNQAVLSHKPSQPFVAQIKLQCCHSNGVTAADPSDSRGSLPPTSDIPKSGVSVYVTQCLLGEFLTSKPAERTEVIKRRVTSGGYSIPGNLTLKLYTTVFNCRWQTRGMQLCVLKDRQTFFILYIHRINCCSPVVVPHVHTGPKVINDVDQKAKVIFLCKTAFKIQPKLQ